MAQLSNTTTISGTSYIQLPSGTTADRPIAIYRTPGTYTWVAPAGVNSVQVLVVGGGGGGGNYNSGGGGGAGGVVYNSAFSVSPGSSYTVTVGAGGAGARGNSSPQSTSGGNSVFSSITAYGGGYGSMNTIAGVGGGNGSIGSGGGGAYTTNTGGAGTTGQGFAGGTGNQTGPNYAEGGGGGAGGVGGTGTSNVAGSGGPGVANSITGIATYYGGGGGGSTQTGGTGGRGGVGGGGHGASAGEAFHNGYPGQANTGGGGGAGGYTGALGTGDAGNGGSGVVIISTLPASVNPVGSMRYNTTVGDLEMWDGNDWTSFIPFEGTITAQLSAPSRTGPTSITTSYTGDLANRVTMINGSQYVAFPHTGVYRIGAYGAQGGCNSDQRGGGGAAAVGDFHIKAGEVIRFLIGSTGGDRSDTSCDTGGGGGTFVLRAPYDNIQSLMLVGGGGGGASATYNGVAGSRFKPLSDGQAGKNANCGVRGVDGAKGYGGAGGFAGDRTLSPSNGGNPGGGFFKGGNSGSANGTWPETTAGFSFLDGAAGGTSNHPNSYGGFGGGAGGHGNCFISGGGGGGYNGGGSQIQYTTRHGGVGGGSYNAGANQQNISGINYRATPAAAIGSMGYATIKRIR